MITPQDILWAVLLPALLAGIILALSAKPWARKAVPAWSLPLALAGGFAIAYVGVIGRPTLPPAEMEAWLVCLAFAGVMVGVIASLASKTQAPRAVTSIAMLLATAWLLRPRTLQGSQMWMMVSVVGIGMVIYWLMLEGLARRVSGVPVPMLLLVTAIATALVVMNAHVRNFALVAGSSVAVLAVAIVLAWWRKINLTGGAVLTLTIILLGLTVCAHLLADLTQRDALILAAAPLAAWVGQVPGIARRKRISLVVSAVAFLAVLAVVLVPAIRGLHETYKEQSESTYY